MGYVNQNDRYLLFECFLHHRLSWIESGAPNSLRCLVACWYVHRMTCRKHSMTSSGVQSMSRNPKYSCLWPMPVVALNSGNGTEYTVEPLESCDHQWLVDVCIYSSTIHIVYVFLSSLGPSAFHAAVGHILLSSHLFSSMAICPCIKTFPRPFKFGRILDSTSQHVAAWWLKNELFIKKRCYCTSIFVASVARSLNTVQPRPWACNLSVTKKYTHYSRLDGGLHKTN